MNLVHHAELNIYNILLLFTIEGYLKTRPPFNAGTMFDLVGPITENICPSEDSGLCLSFHYLHHRSVVLNAWFV